MRRRLTIRLPLLLTLCLAFAPARAEGPLYVGGPNDAVGVPFRWGAASLPLQYFTDVGNLGSTTNTQADGIVSDAFDVWEGVPTASISFVHGGDLGGDVTGANGVAVINAIEGCGALGTIAKNVSIIYDTNGSIVDALYGPGNSDNILGFATATCLSFDGTNNNFTRGYAVMNGKGNPPEFELKAVMIHEFGHMLGLDHSQVNVECLRFGCLLDDDALDGLPTMFPILEDAVAMAVPAQDDIAGISALYPETVNDPPSKKVPFASTTGTITGRVYFFDPGLQAQSINVIARREDDPATIGVNESKFIAVSSVSGFLFTADSGNSVAAYPGSPSPNGTRELNLLGYFEIPGLPPGNYTLEIEEIDPEFTLGSGVGPVAAYGAAFRMPSSGCPDGEFFDSAEADNDLCTTSTPINVNAGQTVPDRDIILNGSPPRFDAWEDGP